MLKRFCVLTCTLLLAACASSPTPDPFTNVRAAPTQPPPQWVESGEVITLENIGRIQLLGRLDSPGTPSTIFAHSLSPDGTRLAALDNEQVLAWDLITGDLVFSTGRGGATRVFYAPDKTEVYTVTPEGSVTIYNANSGMVQNTFQSIDNFNDLVAFDPEDGWLAFSNLNGEVKIWDPLERQSLVTFKAHDLQISALAFSEDGERLATAGEEGTVKVWDWRNRALIQTFTDDRPAYILRFAPDGAQLAAGKREHLRLWSVDSGDLQRTIETGRGGTAVLAYSPDGRYLVSGGAGEALAVWNPQTGGLVAQLPGVGTNRVSLAFSPDGAILLTSSIAGRATLWNMTTLSTTTVNNAALETDTLIFSVDWTSDNRLLTLFGTSGGVYLWGLGAPGE